MNSLLLYLLQSAAGLLLFYGFYRLVLSRERSFRFNRFYLLLTPVGPTKGPASAPALSLVRASLIFSPSKISSTGLPVR